MSSKRILVTGISSYWGGKLAQRLESDPEVETVIGVDRDEPPSRTIVRIRYRSAAMTSSIG